MAAQEKGLSSTLRVTRTTKPPSLLPTAKPETLASPPKDTLHPAFYVIVWISLSSAVILFNKWILDPMTKDFRFPIFLTTWHLVFSSIATQVLARSSTLLDGRKAVKMTGKVYLRAICPIGLVFSLSLICSNKAYLYLSVSFIQMLKATTPVAVLIAAWGLGIEKPNLSTLRKVTFIIVGVMIASYGEILFHSSGFLFQIFGIAFEAIRLVMVQSLLSSAEYKMDPLVSLYYFAPACATMNFILFMVFESGSLGMSDLLRVGWLVFLLNALVAFALNISVVMLIGKTSSLVLTLCGVLKDILLVCASRFIWGNPVTTLQLFGYSLALSGLLYYRLGADKIREHMRFHGSFGRSLGSRRTGIGALLIFAIMGLGAVYRDYLIGGTIPSTHDSPGFYNPSRFTSNGRVSKRSLDIVLSMHQGDAGVVRNQIAEILSLPQFTGLNSRIVLYTTDPKADVKSHSEETGANEIVKVRSKKGHGSTIYLNHILKEWNKLAGHTVFFCGEVRELARVKARIEDFFTPSTGMLSLGSGHASCACGECRVPGLSENTWTRVPEVFSVVYGELCLGARIVLSYGSQFIVSRKRINLTKRHVYEHLKELLEANDTPSIRGNWWKSELENDSEDLYFGHSLEGSWVIVFRGVKSDNNFDFFPCHSSFFKRESE